MTKASIFRTVGLVVVLVNAVLAIFGIPFVIPAEFNEAITSVVLIGYAVYTAVKNDFFKKKTKDEKKEEA
jgi:SPP1 family holin